jgi:ribosome-associated heat shock protein Hsp15
MQNMSEKIRIDKWLWAARFFKTRTLATDEIGKGRILVNGQLAKPSREVKLDDILSIKREGFTQTVSVLGLSQVRGSASIAQLLYKETEDSIQAKLKWAEQRKYAREPSSSIENGRPTKRNRRDLDQTREHGWNDRWSASIE